MNVRQTLVGFIGGLTLAFASERAVGYPVTWQFAGEVTAVFDPNNLLGGGVTVGSPFVGSYTFESTTQDISPDVPSSGFYVGALTAVSGEVGGIPFSGPLESENSILVLNDWFAAGFDNYSIFAGVDFLGEGAGFSMNLRDPSGTMFSSDSLVLSPPALELLDPDRTGFSLGFSTEDLGIGGELISLTPEPGALALLVVGSLALIARRRHPARRRARCPSERRQGVFAMNAKKLVAPVLAVIVIGMPPRSVEGYPVTWQFAGEVTSVVDTLDLLGGAVTVGSPFSGSYTFETTTPDIVPANPDRARYVDLIVALFGQIENQAFVGPVGSTNQIDIWNGVSDSYIASAEVDLSGQILDFQLSLSAGPGTTFSSDALSVAPPDPSVFEHARFLITNESETSPFSVRGDVIWLVPEPATLPLLGLGALLLARCGSRVNRRSRFRQNRPRLEGFNSVSSLTFLFSAFHLLPTTWACAADCNNNGIDDTCDINCAAPGCSQPCDGWHGQTCLPVWLLVGEVYG